MKVYPDVEPAWVYKYRRFRSWLYENAEGLIVVLTSAVGLLIVLGVLTLIVVYAR